MRKSTPNEMLRHLLEIEKMFKNSSVAPKKKTELLKLEERRNPNLFNAATEFENMYATLPKLIASVRRHKNLDEAAFYVGLLRGIVIRSTVEIVDDEPDPVISARRVADVFFTPSKKPDTLH